MNEQEHTQQGGSTLSPLFTWRGALSSTDSTLTPTQRHVALTLSLHMNERGGSCFPSVDTLMNETGLSRRAVQTSLREIEAKGWLAVERGGGLRKNGRGQSSTYTATIPKGAGDAPLPNGAADDVEPRTKRPVTAQLSPSNGAAGAPEDVIESVIEDDMEDANAPGRARVGNSLHGVHVNGLIAHWLRLPGMTQHRPSYFDTKIRQRLVRAVGKYGAEDVAAAMTAYAEVLASPAHFWQHRWTLGDFLTRGLDRFVPEADPHTTFLTKTAKPGMLSPEQIAAKAEELRRQGR